MKDQKKNIRLYNFSHPLMETEVLSVLTDKYRSILPFECVEVYDLDQADIVLWDGVLTPKNQTRVEKMMETINSGRVLFVLGESQTLFKDHPIVKFVDPSGLNFVELPGWSLLPEDLLQGLNECYKKLNHA